MTRLAALAISSALTAFAFPVEALASSCIQDRIGEPVNCTANDIRITDFHDIVVVDDGCASSEDTVTFNAVLTVVTTATSRYDIGLFIGVDGEQALLGDCRVFDLPTGPPPFRDLDHDTCGDTSSADIINIPVEHVRVNCVDANDDHQLDVASCTSWEQNGNIRCTGPIDVEPGTPSKCNCPDAPIDIPIFVPEPICVSNEDCTNLTTGCGRGICDSANPDAGANGCVFIPDDSECNDGQFCNGVETCGFDFTCRAGTPPSCDDAQQCTMDMCNESTDSCVHAPVNSRCSDGQFCNGNEVCRWDPLESTCRHASLSIL